MNWIVRAWRYSRTIFINAASAILAMLAAVIPMLLDQPWDIVLTPKVLFIWMLFLKLMNIALRYETDGPVGGK